MLFPPVFPSFSLRYAESIIETRGNQIIKTAALEECIETALKNNRLRPASLYAVEMAEAQHRQTLSGY